MSGAARSPDDNGKPLAAANGAVNTLTNARRTDDVRTARLFIAHAFHRTVHPVAHTLAPSVGSQNP